MRREIPTLLGYIFTFQFLLCFVFVCLFVVCFCEFVFKGGGVFRAFVLLFGLPLYLYLCQLLLRGLSVYWYIYSDLQEYSVFITVYLQPNGSRTIKGMYLSFAFYKFKGILTMINHTTDLGFFFYHNILTANILKTHVNTKQIGSEI